MSGTGRDVPDIREVFLRNLDHEALLHVAEQLSHPKTRRSVLEEATLDLKIPATHLGIAPILRAILDWNLRNLVIDRRFLEWTIGFTLDIEVREEVLAELSTLDPHVSISASTEMEVLVSGTDGFLLMIQQPLDVVFDTCLQIFAAWKPIVDNNIETAPQLYVQDRQLAALECFIIDWLNASLKPLVKGDQHLRFGTVTQVGNVTDVAVGTADELGFIDVGTAKAMKWETNVEFALNESCHPLRGGEGHLDEQMLADPYYGQAYSKSVLSNSRGIYLPTDGATEAQPLAIADSTPLADSLVGWSDLPFRRSPRFRVESKAQLDLVLSEVIRRSNTAVLPGSPGKILFRGQTREYVLEREDRTKQVLFGRTDTLEPALLSSSTRRACEFISQMAFGTAVQGLLAERIRPQANDRGVFESTKGDMLRVALAQHYGLPTPFLDLTSHPLVAFWFALNKLTSLGNGTFLTEPVPDEQEAVIYVLSPPSSNVVSVSLSGLAVRPTQQHGWVSTSSWGLRPNRVARYLLATIVMPGRIRKELDHFLPSPSQLFPGRDFDPLVRWIHSVCDASPTSQITEDLRRDLYEI